MEGFLIGIIFGALAVAMFFSILLIIRNIKEYKKLIKELDKEREEEK